MKKIVLKVVNGERNSLKLEMNKEFLRPYEHRRAILTKVLALVLRELDDCPQKLWDIITLDEFIKEAKEIAGLD